MQTTFALQTLRGIMHKQASENDENSSITYNTGWCIGYWELLVKSKRFSDIDLWMEHDVHTLTNRENRRNSLLAAGALIGNYSRRKSPSSFLFQRLLLLQPRKISLDSIIARCSSSPSPSAKSSLYTPQHSRSSIFYRSWFAARGKLGCVCSTSVKPSVGRRC